MILDLLTDVIKMELLSLLVVDNVCFLVQGAQSSIGVLEERYKELEQKQDALLKEDGKLRTEKVTHNTTDSTE